MSLPRRRLLAALATTGAVTTAGCLDRFGASAPPGDSESGEASDGSGLDSGDVQVDLGVPCSETVGPTELSGGRLSTEFEGARATADTTYDDGEIPLRERSLHLGHERETISSGERPGGVSHDGIPSIDEPQFARAGDVELPACERVFGVSIDGDVRAYPQRILVRHEIVNDVVGGEPVAVTYCPLTGTALGFYRGGVEFGVSGWLVNSNLIMWDRAFDVRWPQVAATAIEVGEERSGGDQLVGRSLREFRVVWTTWGRWRDRHPETLVMTTDTGFARTYNTGPYGSYTPVSGHYAMGTSRQPRFPLLIESDDGTDEKRVVLGARTAEGAIAFDKRTLLEEATLSGSLGGTPVVAVADSDLATGYVYRNPEGLDVTPSADGYAVADDVAPAGELPLEPILAFEAMWFAWYGFYPDTGRVGL